MSDPEITAKVKRETLEHAFDLQRPLRNVDKIFKRVFGKEGLGVGIRGRDEGYLPIINRVVVS